MHKLQERNQLFQKLYPQEILIHLVITVLISYHLWGRVEADNLLIFFGLVLCVSLLKYMSFRFYLQTEYSEEAVNETSPSQVSSRHVDIFLMLSNASLGLVWGGFIPFIHYLGISQPSDQLVPLFGMAILAFMTIIGSVLRYSLFLAYSIPSFLIPLLFYGWHEQVQLAAICLGLLLISFFIARVTRSLDDILERYRQSMKGNAVLLEVLASSRDEALESQRKAEEARETIKGEIDERKRAEEKIRASEQELSRILQDMQDTFFRIDETGMIVRLSPSVEYLLGIDANDLIGKPGSALFLSTEDYKSFIDALSQKMGVVQNYEVRMKHSLGYKVWASINAHYYYQDGKKKAFGIEGTAHDITGRMVSAEALYQEKERLQVTLESIGDGVITTNVNGYVQYINPVAETMTGWSTSEGKGKPLATVMNLLEEDSDKVVSLPMKEWLSEGRRMALTAPAVLVHHDGDEKAAIELTGAPIRDSKHGVIGSVLVFRDVSKIRSLAKQLSYQATHDSLTGLINRIEFDTRVEQAILSSRGSGKSHALCYLDLDQFKVVNDTCGHHAGDELLKQLTSLLLKSLRDSDILARLGGDEFGVLLYGCPIVKAQDIAENLRKLVEGFRFIWQGKSFRVGLSIGVVSIDQDTQGLTELLSAADSACYVAKERGRNCVHVFEVDDKAVAEHHGQMRWMQRIQRALDNDLFELYIQAIVPVNGSPRKERHGEILLRMIDDNAASGNDVIPPNAFIPAAERYHLMPQIDRWVMRHTFYELVARQGKASQLTTCAINLSGQSLGDLKLLEFIVQLLKETKVPPRSLCFEITESAVIANLDVAKEFITCLKKMGCRFALDDFGSGLSSFGYLKHLPVDYVKLDGSIVRDIAESRVNHAMIQAINYVTHVMGMKSIAEYVENEAVFKALRAISVDYAQGYAIERPRFFARAHVSTVEKQDSEESLVENS